MKLEARAAEGFIARPDASVRAVLLYGSDAGLIRERGDRLARAVVEDLRDPFRVADLGQRALLDDPARLHDEAAALSFTGGRPGGRVRDAGDGVAARFESFFAEPVGELLLVVGAGDLGRRSERVCVCRGAR